MIPAADLLRLLRSLVSGVTSDTVRRSGSDGFTLYPDLDDQDFATLARVAAGEAWEGSDGPV